MKPLGLTPALRVTRPSVVEDAVWTAVQEAIAGGWTAAQFKSEVAEAWAQELRDQARSDDAELRR